MADRISVPRSPNKVHGWHVLAARSARGKHIRMASARGELSLAQARSIAGNWKSVRRAGRDPVAEWEGLLGQERSAAEERRAMVEAEARLPTVTEAVESFMTKIMEGKKSAPAVRYRLERLTTIVGDKKIRDVTRQDVIAALDSISEGRRKGKTAKQLTGEVLVQAKRLWRFAKSREWVSFSCVEELMRRDFGARAIKRNVVLRLDEVAAIWRVLDNPQECKSDPVTVAAMKLLILTGQRENEVCEAPWEEFDLSAGLWKISRERTKGQRGHLVHLSPQSVAILEALKPVTGTNYLVFASPIKPGQAPYGRSVNNATMHY